MSEIPLRLEVLLETARRDLDRVGEGTAVCALTTAGTPAPAFKLYEGRWAALREASARLREHPHSASAVVRALRDSWTTDLERRIGSGAGADWIAYRRGGVEALDDLLATSTGTPDS